MRIRQFPSVSNKQGYPPCSNKVLDPNSSAYAPLNNSITFLVFQSTQLPREPQRLCVIPALKGNFHPSQSIVPLTANFNSGIDEPIPIWNFSLLIRVQLFRGFCSFVTTSRPSVYSSHRSAPNLFLFIRSHIPQPRFRGWANTQHRIRPQSPLRKSTAWTEQTNASFAQSQFAGKTPPIPFPMENIDD